MKTLDAINHFGTGAKVAKALGIKPPAIYQWGENVPELRAFQLERLTEGKLTAENNSSDKEKPATGATV